MFLNFVVVLSMVAALSGWGGASASSSPKPTPAQRKIDRLTAFAKHHFAEEVNGAHASQTLHRLGSDPTLLGLLAAHDVAGARAYVKREYWGVWYHWHVSRMRITQGSRVVSEQGVVFAMPASHMTLRGPAGRNLGTLYVSMQDEIGFVRLMHRIYPSLQVVIRGHRSKQLRTSFYSAAFVKLPSTGSVRIRGHRYLVRSFQEKAWSGEAVTIWTLMKS